MHAHALQPHVLSQPAGPFSVNGRVPSPISPARPIRDPHRPFAGAFSAVALTLLLAAVLVLSFIIVEHDRHGMIQTAPASPAATRSTPVGEWSSMRGDASRAGAVTWPAPTGSLSLRWRLVLPGVTAGLAMSHGTVYAMTDNGYVYAADAKTGAQRWASSLGHVYSDPSNVPIPTIADDRVFVADSGGTLHVLDAANGVELWSYASDEAVPYNIVTADGLAYVSTTTRLLALNARDGKLIWQQPYLSPVSFSVPAAADGVLVTGDDTGDVQALDAKTGAARWTTRLSGQLRAPAVAGGRVFITSGDGYLAALDAATGKELWRAQSPAGWSRYRSPSVADGIVIAAVQDTAVVAFDAATGRQLWSFASGADAQASYLPVVAGHSVYFAIERGGIVELDLMTGRELAVSSAPISGGSAVVPGLDAIYVANFNTIYALAPGAATPVAILAAPPTPIPATPAATPTP